MYKRVFLTMATAAAVLAVVPMTVASAATPHVLTVGKVGGTAVSVGDIIKVIQPVTGTKVTFFSPGTTTGITCTKATVTEKVVTNPLKPGTATESLTGQTFGNCTSNVAGVTAVNSVTVLGLPYKAAVSDAAGFPVTVTKLGGGSLSTKIVVTVLNVQVACTYTKAKLSGNASNTGQKDVFKNQVFTLSLGNPNLCPASGAFSASLGPKKDTSMTGSPLVFVN